tara:strand:+ start:1275 stop:1622 length:348 start_codon:yes stop_codon:yes gene_type:complete
MNLKELQGMIKEELDAYVNEQEVDVDVDAGDVDADGAESGDDSEDMLRKIYDMLKDKFEDEEDSMDETDMDEDMMDETDMDEDMMDEAKEDEEKSKKEASHLQERFKKLANIVKG